MLVYPFFVGMEGVIVPRDKRSKCVFVRAKVYLSRY